MTAAAERFATARQAADAVLFEGYVLYPYRASSAKNRMRWQFGVLVPPVWASASGEPVLQRTEILMEPRADAALHAELRFLHAQRRTVERMLLDGEFELTDQLQLPDRVLVPWDEGVEERVEVSVDVAALTAEDVVLPFTVPATEDSEIVTGADGFPAGRVVRRRGASKASCGSRPRNCPAPTGCCG